MKANLQVGVRNSQDFFGAMKLDERTKQKHEVRSEVKNAVKLEESQVVVASDTFKDLGRRTQRKRPSDIRKSLCI